MERRGRGMVKGKESTGTREEEKGKRQKGKRNLPNGTLNDCQS